MVARPALNVVVLAFIAAQIYLSTRGFLYGKVLTLTVVMISSASMLMKLTANSLMSAHDGNMSTPSSGSCNVASDGADQRFTPLFTTSSLRMCGLY